VRDDRWGVWGLGGVWEKKRWKLARGTQIIINCWVSFIYSKLNCRARVQGTVQYFRELALAILVQYSTTVQYYYHSNGKRLLLEQI